MCSPKEIGILDHSPRAVSTKTKSTGSTGGHPFETEIDLLPEQIPKNQTEVKTKGSFGVDPQ